MECKNSAVSSVSTVLARLYAPPFCIVVRRKRRGGRLIESCTYAPSLHPPPTLRYKVVPGNSTYTCTVRGELRMRSLAVATKITIINSCKDAWQDCRPCTFPEKTQLGYLPNIRSTKTIRRQRTGCSLCLHLPRQDKSPGKADRPISEHKLRR